MTRTRVFFVSDVHGSDKLFLKLLNAVAVYKAQVLIVGGDVAAKVITPIFESGDCFVADVQGSRRTAKGDEELELLKKDIRLLGDYPFVTTEEAWGRLLSDQFKIDRVFDQLIAESLERWFAIAEQRLKPHAAKLIMNRGNDDPQILEDVLGRSNFVQYPNEKVVWVDDKHEMVSLGYSNLTPWNLPGDLPEEILASKMESLVSLVNNIGNCIFNIHVPPHNTLLDIAPKLDKDLRPVLTPGGEPEMVNVGSTAVRHAIEKHQPLLGLHGHIHESRGYSKIGRTYCFNPGSEYRIGVLKGVILNLSDDKLENYVFTAG